VNEMVEDMAPGAKRRTGQNGVFLQIFNEQTHIDINRRRRRFPVLTLLLHLVEAEIIQIMCRITSASGAMS
jgi:hypothetical protein